MNYYDDKQDLTKILTNIKNHLDNFDSSKIFQECKKLRICISKCYISAMIVHRLQKISQLTKSTLSDNIEYVKREIEELLRILTNFVSWHCKACDETIDAEHKNKLTLWVKVHEISDDHNKNMKNFMK
jgi:glutaredoxin-related protein